MYIHIDGAFT